MMKKHLSCFALALAAASSAKALYAATLEVDVEIPRLKVAEYHRPYVALWLQGESRGDITNLAVWYDGKMANEEGEKWLKDMRQWWRRSGRSIEVPVDGVTGATRAPGVHTLKFDDDRLAELPPGQYELWVEATREVGGREIVKIPFTWPVEEKRSLGASGSSELGRVQLRLAP